MTELDFDELDQAVTTLMSGVDTSKRKEGLDDPEDKVVTIPASASPDADLSVAIESSVSTETTSQTVPAVNLTPEVKTSEPLAVKRRGQFMDVFHPSSDMKSSAAPKREGVTLQPTSPFVSSEPAVAPDQEPMSNEPTTPSVVDIVTSPSAEADKTESSQTDEPDEHSWPDPIDLANESEATHDSLKKDANESTTKDADAVPEDVVKEVAAPEVEQSSSSPFITDAKVEKRPLGTAASFPESVATPDVSQPAPEPVASTPLPEELTTDVMALESSSTSSDVETAPEKTPLGEKEVQPEQKHSTVPGSIPQQYTEQASTNNVSNTAIYDTSTHQPLENGLKKSSPMKWVILALVLLIVGALAGAAYFYFKTQ